MQRWHNNSWVIGNKCDNNTIIRADGSGPDGYRDIKETYGNVDDNDAVVILWFSFSAPTFGGD